MNKCLSGAPRHLWKNWEPWFRHYLIFPSTWSTTWYITIQTHNVLIIHLLKMHIHTYTFYFTHASFFSWSYMFDFETQVDIQALAHAVELTRQGAIDSLRFAKGDLFLAFQVTYNLQQFICFWLLFKYYPATVFLTSELLLVFCLFNI